MAGLTVQVRAIVLAATMTVALIGAAVTATAEASTRQMSTSNAGSAVVALQPDGVFPLGWYRSQAECEAAGQEEVATDPTIVGYFCAVPIGGDPYYYDGSPWRKLYVEENTTD